MTEIQFEMHVGTIDQILDGEDYNDEITEKKSIEVRDKVDFLLEGMGGGEIDKRFKYNPLTGKVEVTLITIEEESND